jgi:glycosyltransferase involved in cell wall biosynthesis
MNVLMTADAVGGVWTYALELARALEGHGVRVRLATMGARPTDSQRKEAASVLNLRLFESDFRLEWMDDPWRDVAAAGDWLLGLEAELRPDVVHLNGYAHGALPWRAPVLVVGHSCVASWWRAVKGGAAPSPAWDCYHREVSRGLHAADFVAAPTRAMLDTLAEEYGPLADAAVIPNGRDASAFTPSAKKPFVLAAGRLWDEAKNVGALARVAPRLPWPVRVAGDARSPDGGEAEYPNVELLGKLPPSALAERLGRASVYALPARYEPFGLSALEAGLAGCALVLGDIPSLREVWGDAALFVAPDEGDALAGALNRLIENDDLRASMAEKARRRALAYTPERMARGYLDVYDRLLAARQDRGK